MMKTCLALIALSVSVARAASFDESARPLLPAWACAADLGAAPAGEFDRLAHRMMLSPAVAQDFFKRLRRTLDQTGAEGVVLTGSIFHRLFVDDLFLEMQVIPAADEPRVLNPKLAMDLDLFRRDRLENSEFLRAFGAREFNTATGRFVVATGLHAEVSDVPEAATITALRQRVDEQLREFLGFRADGSTLPTENVFGQIRSCRDFAPDSLDFSRICVSSAVSRIFKSVKHALPFAAGPDAIIILKSGAPNAGLWFQRLAERGYANVYSLRKNGVPHLLRQPPTPPRPPRAPKPVNEASKRVTGGRAGRVQPTSAPQSAPSLRVRR